MNASTRKCLVWDLDNTLWNGICLEGDVHLRPEAPRILAELDARGILHSIASRGEQSVARAQLEAFGLDHWFLAPRINWLPKPTNLEAIAQEIGIGTDALAFIDDDPFERDHMAFMRPEILVLDAADLARVPALPSFQPESVTVESGRRRAFYQEDTTRQAAAAGQTDRQTFLAACRMRLTVRPPLAADIPRIRELMTRTHQLNTTGLMLDAKQIQDLLPGAANAGPNAVGLTVADLEDRFGSYGTIGVALTIAAAEKWRLTYLAMSCRVLGRGVESAFLHTLLSRARRHGYHRIEALMNATGRNDSMRTLYQMSGLRALRQAKHDGTIVFIAEPGARRSPPTWVDIRCESF